MSTGNRFDFSDSSIADFSRGVTHGRRYAYDTGTNIKGFCAMFTDKGAVSFYVYRKIDSVPVRFFCGSFGNVTIEQARLAAIEYNKSVSAGLHKYSDDKRVRHYKRIQNAGHTVKMLIKEGILKKPTDVECCKCGSAAHEYHHPDYKRPAHVIAVCKRCHAKIHNSTEKGE